MSNLLNIFNSKKKQVPDQQIIDYLQGQLPAEGQHQLEENELDDIMMQDALDGLKMLNDKSSLQKTTNELNNQLQKRINTQKGKRLKNIGWQDQQWILITAVIIILLIMTGFLIIRRISS